MKMKNLIFLVLALGLFSCTNGSNSKGEDTSATTVEGEVEAPALPSEMLQREWILLKYEEDGKVVNLQNDSEITLKLNATGCFGIGGCNNYGTNYTLVGENGIQFGEIGATKKICNSMMGQEMKYFELLKATSTYDYKDALLTLSGPNGKLTYRYKPAAPKE